jgi:hypothetical protein
MAWSKLVDMSMDDEDILDAPMPIPMADKPRFPFGLRICLTGPELAKLGLDADCDEGDMLDMRCFATVTAIHKEDGNCRVELQIERMSVEDESQETEED